MEKECSRRSADLECGKGKEKPDGHCEDCEYSAKRFDAHRKCRYRIVFILRSLTVLALLPLLFCHRFAHDSTRPRVVFSLHYAEKYA